MTKPTCASCAFWEVDSDNAGVGECRIRAPQPRELEEGDSHVFPVTGATDWCGEHHRFTAEADR